MDGVRGLGRAIFAAILLMVGGVLNIIYGIGAARPRQSRRQRFSSLQRGTEVRFRPVAAERAQHDVARLCTMAGVTRQRFYAWRRRDPSARHLQDQQLKALVADAQ